MGALGVQSSRGRAPAVQALVNFLVVPNSGLWHGVGFPPKLLSHTPLSRLTCPCSPGINADKALSLCCSDKSWETRRVLAAFPLILRTCYEGGRRKFKIQSHGKAHPSVLLLCHRQNVKNDTTSVRFPQKWFYWVSNSLISSPLWMHYNFLTFPLFFYAEVVSIYLIFRDRRSSVIFKKLHLQWIPTYENTASKVTNSFKTLGTSCQVAFWKGVPVCIPPAS